MCRSVAGIAAGWMPDMFIVRLCNLRWELLQGRCRPSTICGCIVGAAWGVGGSGGGVCIRRECLAVLRSRTAPLSKLGRRRHETIATWK